MTMDDTTEELAECNFKNDPKDLKRSIRNKYNRRLRWLGEILDDFMHHAEERLDEERAGKIHNREETIELINECAKLREIIIIKPLDDYEISENAKDKLNAIFGISS